MTDFMEIVAGSRHVLALRKDGTVWSWGNNEKGQLGYKEDGHIEPNYYRAFQKTPKQIPDLKNIVSIAAGSGFSLALDKEGRVWGWGSESYLLGNHGNINIKQPDPKVIYQHVDAIKVVANGTVGLGVLLKTGKVKLWSAADVYEPIFNDPVVDIAMSYSNTYFLLNTGRVYALGSNISGELAQRGDEELKNPKLIKQIGRIKKISTYTALDEQGRVWQWGKEAGLEIDTLFSGRSYYAQFYPSVMLSHKKITDVYCCTAALDADGTVWFWGNDTTGRRGNNQKSINYQNQKNRDWTTPVRSLWTWK
jgi:alpha-tubulin suppressor-like RCC1 family protein